MENKFNTNIKKSNKIVFEKLENEQYNIKFYNDNKIVNDFLFILNIKTILKLINKKNIVLLSENVLLSKIFLTDLINKKGLIYL